MFIEKKTPFKRTGALHTRVVQRQLYIPSMEHYIVMKKNLLSPNVSLWVNLRSTRVNEKLLFPNISYGIVWCVFKIINVKINFTFSTVNICVQRYLKKSTKVIKLTTVVVSGKEEREEGGLKFAVFFPLNICEGGFAFFLNQKVLFPQRWHVSPFSNP